MKAKGVSRGRLDVAARAVQLLRGDVRDESPPAAAPREEPAPSFDELRSEHVDDARRLLSRDVTDAVRWPWRDLSAMVGPLLEGEVHVVGALTNNGKSTFLMSAMDAFAQERVPVLYFPLEVSPDICRVQWAAFRLGFAAKHAMRQEWDKLPEGARESMENILEEQEQDDFIHFAPETRATVSVVKRRCQRAADEFGCRILMLDHLGRMDFGESRKQPRELYGQMMKDLKDMAKELRLVVVASAQLNRTTDPLDYFSPPHIARLAESASIGWESDVTLMLSRKLRGELPDGYAFALKVGRITENDIAEPGIMRVTCRKHRIDDDARDHSVYLRVDNGRLTERWAYPPPRGT